MVLAGYVKHVCHFDYTAPISTNVKKRNVLKKNEAKKYNEALFWHYIGTFFQGTFVRINTNRNDE